MSARPTIDVRALADSVQAWQHERGRLSQLEDDPLGPPDPDDWHANDDEAAELVKALAPLVDPLCVLASLDSTLWYDIGSLLTCREADTLAELLNLVNDGAGDNLLFGHEKGDDQGDSHYVGNLRCTACSVHREDAPEGCDRSDPPYGDHQWAIFNPDSDPLVVEYRRIYGDHAELAAIPTWEAVTNVDEPNPDLEGMWRSAQRALNPAEDRQPCPTTGTTIILVDEATDLWLHTSGPGCYLHGEVGDAR